LACSIALVVTGACHVEGQNSVSRRLLREVTLDVSGRVVSGDQGEAIPGATVQLLRANVGEDAYAEVADAYTVTAADGSFDFLVGLDVETYLYRLSVTDADGLYAMDSNTDLYALRDGDVDVGTIALLPLVEELDGVLTGRVRAAVGGPTGIPNLEGVGVVVRDPVTGEALTEQVESDADGRFELPRVPFKSVDLELTSPSASAEDSFALIDSVSYRLLLGEEFPDRDEDGTARLDLGDYFLPATGRRMLNGKLGDDFLTIVLSWESDQPAGCDTNSKDGVRDLDALLYLPGADCDVNHLGGMELALATGAALDPAGLGSGTCFWPPFLGGAEVLTVGQDIPGAAGTEARVLLSQNRPYQFLSQDPRFADAALAGVEVTFDASECPDPTLLAAQRCGGEIAPAPAEDQCSVAALDHASDDGLEPEIVTLFRNRFTREWPTRLGYYYELEVTDDGEQARRYPMGIATFTVAARSGSLNEARPVVEVYDRGQSVARYTLSRLESQTDAQRWTPFLLEIGSRQPDASDASDIYFRVVPYDQVAVSVSSPPYFYQDITVNRAVGDEGSGVTLSGASCGVDIPERGLFVLGQTRVAAEQLPAVFSFDKDLGWAARALPPGRTQGLVREKDGQLLVALGDKLYLESSELVGEDETEPFCGGNVLDLAGDPDDPAVSFLVSTDAGLAHLLGPRQQGPDKLPPSCEALGDPSAMSTKPPSRLAWMRSQQVYVGAVDNVLGALRVRFGQDSAVDWLEQGTVELDDRAPILSLLVVGNVEHEDLFVGTERGLYVLRGAPGQASPVRIEDCAGAEESDTNRPPAASSPVRAMAQFGARLFVGTQYGVAVTSSSSNPQTGDPGHENPLCLAWLPTQVASGAPTAFAEPLPVLPPGLDVTDLVVSDGRLYVLTSDRGIFYLNGGGQ
jgi:hypothetical protein